MVRTRFAKLPQAQQQAILSAALDEFSTHGFHDASLNRVIEAAGISKGSLYYYFDGKDDLYAYVARVELERLLAHVEPFDLTHAGTPDAFWAELERFYLRSMAALEATPELAALIRGWMAASSTPALQEVQQELLQAVLPWMERLLTEGRRIGAVRSDLPSGLLIAVAGGMGQAMDTWLIAQPLADPTELPRLVSALAGMIRRALEP